MMAAVDLVQPAARVLFVCLGNTRGMSQRHRGKGAKTVALETFWKLNR